MLFKQSVLFCVLNTALVAISIGFPAWWSISFEPQPARWVKSDPQKVLKIKLTNTTDQVRWVFESNSLNDYDLSATDFRAKAVPMTEDGTRLQERQRSRFLRTGRFSVAAGSSYRAEINLDQLYKFAPGKYVIHVRLRAINQEILDEKTNQRTTFEDKDMPTGATPIEITQ